MPAEVVLASGLDLGIALDRPRARRVGRELRRHEAQAKALRALARRDLSERELTERLARSQVAPAAREQIVSRLVRAGALDDTAVARRRAEQLAERGAGDALIRHDLLGRGIAADVADRAVAGLEPEPARAARILEARGRSPKTARFLARRGFADDLCEQAVAEDAPPAVR